MRDVHASIFTVVGVGTGVSTSSLRVETKFKSLSNPCADWTPNMPHQCMLKAQKGVHSQDLSTFQLHRSPSVVDISAQTLEIYPYNVSKPMKERGRGTHVSSPRSLTSNVLNSSLVSAENGTPVVSFAHASSPASVNTPPTAIGDVKRSLLPVGPPAGGGGGGEVLVLAAGLLYL
ncbi:hypothetical protein BDV93DRAFT_6751 [Ceratobasidium sp. AG-I]|nr:hypothetical protein BDV93DRAFT_6751 [Ceratobasidium sp. AG-I]